MQHSAELQTARAAAETAKAVQELVEISTQQEERLAQLAVGQADLADTMRKLVEASTRGTLAP